MKNTVEVKEMLSYLQSMLDRFVKEKEQFGIEERGVQNLMTRMLACKDMVETLIGEPVNLQKDGKVTVGF